VILGRYVISAGTVRLTVNVHLPVNQSLIKYVEQMILPMTMSVNFGGKLVSIKPVWISSTLELVVNIKY
jgi:hypothetical protein